MAIYFPNSELGEVLGETWRITSQFSGDNNLIGGNSMTNWERSDDVYGGGNVSSSPVLSYSASGQFSFNYTGYYLVNFQHYAYYNDNNRYAEMTLMVSWNSGANWDTHAYSTSSISPNTSENYSQVAHGTSIVAGTTAARLRFNMQVHNNSTYTYGETNGTATGFSVVKIAEL